jgi:putative transposase
MRRDWRSDQCRHGLDPNEDSILHQIGTILFAQNDDWQGEHRYMMVKTFWQIDATRIDPLQSTTT